jgi:predicted amidohydrolase YtcJ
VVNDRTLIVGAQVNGRVVDVTIIDGVITGITGISDAIEPNPDDLVVEAGAGALIPGLHDHHVHLLAMAARREGLDLDPLGSPSEFDEAVALAAGAVGDGWVRASGHDEHRHGALDRYRLDAIAPGARVRVQHRSGLAWVLSSAALAEVDVGPGGWPEGVELDERGEPTGRLLRLDAWMAESIGVRAPSIAAIGTEMASLGITGVTDATGSLGAGRLEILRDAVRDGSLPQRLVLLGVDDPADVEGWAHLGPAKIVIDELHGLDPDALAAEIADVHRVGRRVAIHAVTRAENVTAATALAIAGPMRGDRIEHGSVLPPDLDPILATGGVVVVVQPSLVRERGDHHFDNVAADDLPFLHRAASLLADGVAVTVGSDAPVTSVDPWLGIASATLRATRTGRAMGLDERVDAATALGWYLADPLDPGGRSRTVRVGAPADLCLLDAPLASVLAEPDRRHVRMTWVAGRLVHR